jgi:hypothetical protein
MAADPYYNNTVLLLHGDNVGDPNGNYLHTGWGGNTTAAEVGTATIGGTAVAGTFGGRKALDLTTSAATTTLALTGATNALFDGDFTVEFWSYHTSTPTQYSLFAAALNGAIDSVYSGCHAYFYSGSLTLYVRNTGASVTFTPTRNVWTHYAVVSVGGSVRLYINGVQRLLFAVANNTSFTTANGVVFGWLSGVTNQPSYAYVMGIRVYKGVARYTAAFTPDYPPLPYSSALDSSPVSRRLNVQGSTANPYTAEYKFGGGCFRFDGASYLAAFTATDLDLGASDWTIEFWAKANSTANGGLLHRGYYDSATTNWTGLAFSIRKLSGATVRFYFYGVSAATEQYIDVANCLPVGSWVHVAMVRRANTGYIYVNGVLSGTLASLNTPAASTQSLRIGLCDYSAASEYFDGFMDDIRITKGIARYTTDFTPPALAFPDGQAMISGTVRDASGALCSRTVNAHSRATGRLLGTAVSDPVTGVYSIGAAETCYVVVLDSTGDYDALILDRINPVT